MYRESTVEFPCAHSGGLAGPYFPPPITYPERTVTVAQAVSAHGCGEILPIFTHWTSF